MNNIKYNVILMITPKAYETKKNILHKKLIISHPIFNHLFPNNRF